MLCFAYLLFRCYCYNHYKTQKYYFCYRYFCHPVQIDKVYDFSVDPELITLVESDPFYGYESETVVAHLTKLIE